jgi:hypothetical protein
MMYVENRTCDLAIEPIGWIREPFRSRRQPCWSIAARASGTVASLRSQSRERRPALQHAVHSFGDVVAAREFGSLFAHPTFELSNQRRVFLLADAAAFVGARSVDRALDCKQR